jgi:hypothetical protein
LFADAAGVPAVAQALEDIDEEDDVETDAENQEGDKTHSAREARPER